MSTNPNSGYTGSDSTANGGGLVDTVKSYIPGLSPTASRDQASGTTTDATAEPAFGAHVGPNSSASNSYTGTGSSAIGETGLGDSSTGLGSSSTGYGSSSTTSGPHSSNLANKADPRVDSDNSRLGSTGTGLGSSSTGYGSSDRDGYVPAPTLNPHDEERAKVVAARAVGGASGPLDSGVKTDHGFDSSASGYRDGRVGETGSGYGTLSSDVGLGSGAGVGSGLGRDSRESGVGLGRESGAGLGRESGVGLGRESGAGLGRDSSNIGSGVGLDSADGTRMGRDSDRPSTYDETRRGSSHSREKTDRALAGESEGATAEESRASAVPRNAEGEGAGSKSSAKRENESAIPTAGGIKLGEKHWGESDIVPENPKPRASEAGVSSGSGQPDQSTRDNTNANVGSSSGPPGSGQDKEGLADKVKHTLHLGGEKK